MKCKHCGDKFDKYQQFNFRYCEKESCRDAGISELRIKQKKAQAKNNRADTRKAKESLLTHKDYLRLLQTTFNAYIRKRDQKLPCISCGKKPPFDLAAGHFYSAGNYSFLRFNELNVHGQCNAHCNMFLGGNIHQYRKNITTRITKEQLQWLDDNCHNELNLSIPEIKDLIQEYKIKIKNIKKN